MNARERQMVDTLLTVVDEATTQIKRALEDFSVEMIQERERQREEAIDAAHRHEDMRDQYNSAMADRLAGRK